MKTKNAFKRIIEVYVNQEKEFAQANPSLGNDAYDEFMKTSKGRIIDSFLTTPPTTVPIDKLTMTHRTPFYSIEAMLWKIDDAEPIHVIKHKGKLLVLDGHHRLLINKIIGQKKIKARVIDLDKKKKRKKRK
jgi:hypothetical protein